LVLKKEAEIVWKEFLKSLNNLFVAI